MTQREILPLVPTRSLVMFPGVVMTLELSGQAGRKLGVELKAGRAPKVLLVAGVTEAESLPGAIGVMARVLHVTTRPGDRLFIVARGEDRRRVIAPLQIEPFVTAEVEPVEETTLADGEGDLVQQVRETAVELANAGDRPGTVVRDLEGIDGPGQLADRAAAHADLPFDDATAILAELDVTERLRKVHAALERCLRATEAARVQDPELRERVLREQMARIQKELGEEPDGPAGGDLDGRIAEANLPAEARAAARREARRLATLDAGSPEAQVARAYLDLILELPWSRRSEDSVDLEAARRILDEDHDGLAKIKKRVVEYLAVRKLNPAKKGPILLLVGPPGVGKTSLGKSIARALGRSYVRVSLGGVRDEAEIRGHRRTYIGALPGRILQGLKRAGTRNPVFVLDEIDKIGAGHRGDPAAALLEVLDPEQNHAFSDHYLELPFDLSEVVFIATANDLSPIPGPLRDRMEVLPIEGYTTEEKRQIARAHLVPRQLAEHGLDPAQLHLDDGALEEIIEGHTREAGVRNLERELARVIRGVAVKVAEGESARTEITAGDLAGYLGPTRFFSDVAERDPRPGVATGLAWTPTGGEVLFIETSLMPGRGELLVTGQLGDVMQESARAAFSVVRSRAAELGIAPGLFERHDVHVHVPAGAVPKDGPSAGQALATALVSLATGRAVRGDVAMTGEITLRGHVLPVGGIAAKVLAAHRAGIRQVILPARNAKDAAELPASVTDAVELRFVSRLSDTLELALEPRADVAVPANGNLPLPRPAQPVHRAA